MDHNADQGTAIVPDMIPLAANSSASPSSQCFGPSQKEVDRRTVIQISQLLRQAANRIHAFDGMACMHGSYCNGCQWL